jgi:hypothetical protein
MNRVYIAGPMRGVPRFNFPAFDAAKKKLVAQGFEVISPADMDRDIGFDPADLPPDYDWHDIDSIGFSLPDAIHRDVEAVKKCNAIYMLCGWERSRGACAEKALAEWMGLTVLYEQRKRLIVGTAGYIYSGKNLAANLIPGAHVVEWADRLYMGLSAILGVPVSTLKRRDVKANGLVVNGIRIDIRKALRTGGTDWGREQLHPDIWVRLLDMDAGSAPILAIAGTRFPNEVEYIRENDGEIWWIDRPGLVRGDHKSDVSLGPDDCDRVLVNNGSITDLESKVASAWADYLAKRGIEGS